MPVCICNAVLGLGKPGHSPQSFLFLFHVLVTKYLAELADLFTSNRLFCKLFCFGLKLATSGMLTVTLAPVSPPSLPQTWGCAIPTPAPPTLTEPFLDPPLPPDQAIPQAYSPTPPPHHRPHRSISPQSHHGSLAPATLLYTYHLPRPAHPSAYLVLLTLLSPCVSKEQQNAAHAVSNLCLCSLK